MTFIFARFEFYEYVSELRLNLYKFIELNVFEINAVMRVDRMAVENRWPDWLHISWSLIWSN